MQTAQTVQFAADFDDSQVFNDAEGRFADDKKLFVQFYSRPVQDNLASNEAKRPIFIDADFVKIMVPGDKRTVIDRWASDEDKQRFPTHFARYKAGQVEQTVGTPLEMLPGMTAGKVEEYKHFGIKTVEMLAEASDSVGQQFMQFQADKSRAKGYLALAKDDAAIKAIDEKFEKENAALREQLDSMQKRFDVLLKTKVAK
jgi:hypothetical protein